MLAILEDSRTGEITSCEVPPPELLEGGVLVQTHFSAISSGTERATIETGKKSMLSKAMARPDLVRQVVDFAQKNGVRAAYRKVQARLETQRTMGYSCAGVVLASAGASEFRPGDRVACAGVGYANHAEINFVPRNLVVRVPEPVSLRAASITTIGAIAMQGIRQAGISCGESVVVVGAGLLGVLAIKIARAAGCRVIAADIDPKRTQLAVAHGAHLGLSPSDPNAVQAVNEFTRYGADAVLITAGAKSSEPTEFGARLLRDRGRIVVVGDVGLGVARSTMYIKELSLHLSRSYGPGRYDPAYEEGGNDYPVGYVRWTEQRNMEAFLDLLASGSINVDALTENVHTIDKGAEAYADVRKAGVYTSLLQYHVREPKTAVHAVQPRSAERAKHNLRVGCIGAGGFARDIIFPNLCSSSSVIMGSIATASGASAESARRAFGFERTQTPSELISNSQIDAVFVVSRHDSHARYVTAAINAGKPVFVEKPLALTQAQLGEIRSAYQSAGPDKPPFVMVGFNRRFAPFTLQAQEFFARRQEPLLIEARINAGYLTPSHWTQGPSGGGRILGEFCHFVDWARYVAGVPIVSVWAAALPDGTRYNRDNVVATLSFSDGSLAKLTYLANGDGSVGKEFYEVFCEGAVARLDDFMRLELARNRKKKVFKSTQDKGHKNEIEKTISAARQGLPAPIPFEQLVEVTETTFAVHESLSVGLPISIGDSGSAAANANDLSNMAEAVNS